MKSLLLTHIPPLVDKAQSEVLASVSAAYSGPVELARNRMRDPAIVITPAGKASALGRVAKI